MVLRAIRLLVRSDDVLTVLVCIATLAVATATALVTVVVMLRLNPPSAEFHTDNVTLVVRQPATVASASTSPTNGSLAGSGRAAKPTGKPLDEVDYVVKRGDTLWSIAMRRYANVAEGVTEIKRRNRLGRDYVLAGEVLVLPPAAGR